MPRKKKLSLGAVIWKVIILSSWNLLFVIIPGAIAIFQFFGGDKAMIANVPTLVWLGLAIIGFICVLVIGVKRYKKESEKGTNKRPRKQAGAKARVMSKRQSGGITAETVNIQLSGQEDKDALTDLMFYDSVDISYYVLAETIEEKRASYRTHRPTERMRLSYLVRNRGNIIIRDCRIKMTGLVLRDSPHNYFEDTTKLNIEDNPIKWKNSNDERIRLGVDSSEPIILAKIPDYNAFAIFHFVLFGDEKRSLNEKVPRTFEGTWNVDIQIEGQAEKNGVIIDLLPIKYTVSFKFEGFSLSPLEVKKHKRQIEEVDGERIFNLSARAPLPKDLNEPRWASINVVNNSLFKIEDCFLTLDNILDKNGASILESRQRNLLWSSGEGEENMKKKLEIIPHVPRVCDVATTFPNNNEMVFTFWAGYQAEPKGVYEVIVSAHGEWKGYQKTETSHFILEYDGGNVITIIEKGRERWQNPDPKKIMERGNQNIPPWATPSS